MSIDLASDLWSELKSYIGYSEREDAAKGVLDLLDDYGFTTDETVAAFSADSDMKEVIQREHPEIQLDVDEIYDDFYEDDDE